MSFRKTEQQVGVNSLTVMPIAASLPPSTFTVSLSSDAWVSRVSIYPKPTQLTLTLYRPHSLARVLVSPMTPDFMDE